MKVCCTCNFHAKYKKKIKKEKKKTGKKESSYDIFEYTDLEAEGYDESEYVSHFDPG
jgi:hypothetical protein